MTKQTDPDVIEQVVEFIEDARNCACCIHFCVQAEFGDSVGEYCGIEGGPDFHTHPASPGRASCNLWESDQLL